MWQIFPNHQPSDQKTALSSDTPKHQNPEHACSNILFAYLPWSVATDWNPYLLYPHDVLITYINLPMTAKQLASLHMWE
jgi:hypothetical protein